MIQRLKKDQKGEWGAVCDRGSFFLLGTKVHFSLSYVRNIDTATFLLCLDFFHRKRKYLHMILTNSS